MNSSFTWLNNGIGRWCTFFFFYHFAMRSSWRSCFVIFSKSWCLSCILQVMRHFSCCLPSWGQLGAACREKKKAQVSSVVYGMKQQHLYFFNKGSNWKTKLCKGLISLCFFWSLSFLMQYKCNQGEYLMCIQRLDIILFLPLTKVVPQMKQPN